MRCAALFLIVQLAAFSALATDRLQTQHWIDGTPSNPLATPAGGFVYETNPVLAGRPWMLDPYFDFLEGVTEAMPRMLSPPWSVPVQALWAAAAIANVARNNDLAYANGLWVAVGYSGTISTTRVIIP